MNVIKGSAGGTGGLDDFIDIKDLAASLGISKWTLYRQLSNGSLPFSFYKIGRNVRFRATDVKEWLESRKITNKT